MCSCDLHGLVDGISASEDVRKALAEEADLPTLVPCQVDVGLGAEGRLLYVLSHQVAQEYGVSNGQVLSIQEVAGTKPAGVFLRPSTICPACHRDRLEQAGVALPAYLS